MGEWGTAINVAVIGVINVFVVLGLLSLVTIIAGRFIKS